MADVGSQVREIERDSPAPERDIEEWERRVEADIDSDAVIPATERTALVQARRGQGRFRSNVRSIERACRITRVERMELQTREYLREAHLHAAGVSSAASRRAHGVCDGS